jgi:hypothetical protein
MIRPSPPSYSGTASAPRPARTRARPVPLVGPVQSKGDGDAHASRGERRRRRRPCLSWRSTATATPMPPVESEGDGDVLMAHASRAARASGRAYPPLRPMEMKGTCSSIPAAAASREFVVYTGVAALRLAALRRRVCGSLHFACAPPAPYTHVTRGRCLWVGVLI